METEIFIQLDFINHLKKFNNKYSLSIIYQSINIRNNFKYILLEYLFFIRFFSTLLIVLFICYPFLYESHLLFLYLLIYQNNDFLYMFLPFFILLNVYNCVVGTTNIKII